MSRKAQHRPSALIAALYPSRNASRVPAMLRTAGCRVTALCARDASLSHSWLIDRYIETTHDEAATLAALRATVEAERFDFVAVADEALLHALGRNLEPWMARVLPFAATPEMCALILDKNKMLDAMERKGIPLPPSLVVRSREQLDAAAARIGYPLVLKDAVGCGGNSVRRVDAP